MAATNFQKGIDELLNRLNEEETDINKICDVTHNVLMVMSVRDGIDIINNKKKRRQNFK